MITEELAEFSAELHADIRAQAIAAETQRETKFVERMGNLLEESGEIEGFNPCSYLGKAGKIDGWYFDDEFNDIVLIVSKYFDLDNLEKANLPNSEVNSLFTQAERFLRNSLKGLHDKIDVSRLEERELARLIFDCGKEIRSVKIVLITDGIAKRREAEISSIDDIEISKTIWDIERTYGYEKNGVREVIGVDFAKDYGGPINCVSLKNYTNRYTTYLAFVPGNVLADMYSKWGIKMLDMNVRVFLSARGNVNKGIKATIQTSPELFCAFNNGITVFARDVELQNTGGNISIVKAHDFQIVNGGQTTASLYHTRKKDISLDSLYVQMKMTVIHDEKDIPLLVPKISEFSNTQNKVQVADLAANQSPHLEIQAISDAVRAPDPTGGSKETHWFYERARGSYEESRNLKAKTGAQKREYDSIRPKSQKFDKIKFAKVWNTFLRMPHLVSLGGQKNFGRFNEWLREQKEEDWTEFFKKTVALLLLWNHAEKIVRRQGFEGYHHNIVAYTLSWFFHLTDNRIDLGKIWKNQSVPASILDTLEQMSSIVDAHIRDTSQNVTEYCKKDECWAKLKDKTFPLPDKVSEEYIASGGGNHYTPSVTSETEAIQFCKDKGGEAWLVLSKWLKERDYLTGKARSQSFNMGRCLKKGKEPSAALSIPCKKIWTEAEVRGWAPNMVSESEKPT